MSESAQNKGPYFEESSLFKVYNYIAQPFSVCGLESIIKQNVCEVHILEWISQQGRGTLLQPLEFDYLIKKDSS